jgi:hypothetical protein
MYIVYNMWYIVAAAPAVCDRRVSRLRHITHVVCVCVCVCLLVYVSVCVYIYGHERRPIRGRVSEFGADVREEQERRGAHLEPALLARDEQL